MSASFLPSVLVPTVGLVFPTIAMAALFLYIERGQATTPVATSTAPAPSPAPEENPADAA